MLQVDGRTHEKKYFIKNFLTLLRLQTRTPQNLSVLKRNFIVTQLET